MRIRVAKNIGFCFGVRRALEMAKDLAKDHGTVFTLGELIHNKGVIAELEEKGIKAVDSPQKACSGSVIMIRSHGAPPNAYKECADAGLMVIDATCPFVKLIHGIVSNAELEGRLPVIIGTRTHPEVEGISGWCTDCKIFYVAEI